MPQLHLTVHVPNQEHINLRFHLNLEIYVWSKKFEQNKRKVATKLTNQIPCLLTIDIPEDLSQNLEKYQNTGSRDQHFIKIKYVARHHPSEDLVSSTYSYPVLKKTPLAQEVKVYIQSSLY